MLALNQLSQLKVWLVRYGQDFSLKHSKTELTWSTECKETTVLTLCQRNLCTVLQRWLLMLACLLAIPSLIFSHLWILAIFFKAHLWFLVLLSGQACLWFCQIFWIRQVRDQQWTQRDARVGWRPVKEQGKWTIKRVRARVSQTNNCRLSGHMLIFLGFPNDYSVGDRKYKSAASHTLQHNQSNDHNPGCLIAQR